MAMKIPKRLKELRKRRNFTLEQLAQLAGCTRSYISQIEKGSSTPSISMLGRLADALDVRVPDLFRDNDEEDQGNWHLRKSDRRTINYPKGNIISQLLTRGVFHKKMQPLISTIQPGGSVDDQGDLTHPKGSEEFVLILKGAIEFWIDNRTILLEEGDTLYFNGELPHTWSNNKDEVAEVLFVWTPPVW